MEKEKMIDRQALFSDESCRFRSPEEPDAGNHMTIRLQALKDNLDKAILHIQTQDKKGNWKDKTIPMVLEKESKKAYAPECHYDSMFCYYTAETQVGEEDFRYYFEVFAGADYCFYNQLGAVSHAGVGESFVVHPGVHVPQWAKGAIMYQIFVDRFYNGDPDNDVLDREYLYVDKIPSEQVKDWNSDILNLDVGRFYGGDLQGVWDKLDYIQELGIEVIYFNPLFVSPSNHKYDIQDYDYIDPHFGVIIEDEGELLDEVAADNRNASRYICRVTSFKNLEASNDLFARLCEEIHRRGMKVIIDGVFNHCGSFNKWLDREKIYQGRPGYEDGAYVSEKSPYHDYFIFKEDKWPDNKTYNGWWDNNTLPKLNYEQSEELCDYIIRIGKKWISPPFNVDGWRLDVAADLGQTPEFNHKFWKRFRKEMKAVNPDCLILAEHYGDCYDWLQGDEWDTIMNYDAFMDPVTWFLTGLEKHSDRYDENMLNNGSNFCETMLHKMTRMHRGSLLTAMNELSNHDHSRFMTKTNKRKGRMSYKGPRAAEQGTNVGIFREGIVMQMTWPGAPTIYYGDETGMCGWTDPDSRRPYPWGQEDHEMIEFFKYITRIHGRNPALRDGSFRFLDHGYGFVVYSRFTEENRVIVAVNNQYNGCDIEIPVWKIGVDDGSEMVRVMSTSYKNYNVGKKFYLVDDGKIKVRVHGYGAVIIRNCNPGEWVDPDILDN